MGHVTMSNLGLSGFASKTQTVTIIDTTGYDDRIARARTAVSIVSSWLADLPPRLQSGPEYLKVGEHLTYAKRYILAYATAVIAEKSSISQQAITFAGQAFDNMKRLEPAVQAERERLRVEAEAKAAPPVTTAVLEPAQTFEPAPAPPLPSPPLPPSDFPPPPQDVLPVSASVPVRAPTPPVRAYSPTPAAPAWAPPPPALPAVQPTRWRPSRTALLVGGVVVASLLVYAVTRKG